MRIQLKKFGTTLTSRQMGKEALAAFQPSLKELSEGENLELDFEGVNTFSPSWGDEFLTPLMERFGTKMMLLHTQNPSVKETLAFLESIGNKHFLIVS